MATQRKPRFMISLDDDTAELLTRLQTFTGLSPAQTIQKIFPSHLCELHEYLTWLEGLPPGPSLQRKMGPHLLQSYGPTSLIQDIKRIDPTFVTEGEKLTAGIAAAQQGK
jgi:hypothetical protein